MSVETTINIKKDVLGKLSFASKITGKSRSSIIVLLIKRVMADSYRLEQTGLQVRYQKRDPLKSWHKLHICLNEDEYEYCLDMRKFYKRSVSFIVSFAICKYLPELVQKLSETNNLSEYTDNYRFKNYILVKEVIDNVICWRIYWGVPYNLSSILTSYA